MKMQRVHKLMLTSLMVILFTSSQVYADNLTVMQDAQGFCYSLEIKDSTTLTNTLVTARDEMRLKQSSLQDKVTKQKFGFLDTVITIVMPGGLLYAAIVRGKHKGREKQLAQVTEDIHQLSADILTFQSTASTLKVASLK
jgi:hypothetical protein